MMDRIRAHWLTLAPSALALVAILTLASDAPVIALPLACALVVVVLTAIRRERAALARASLLAGLADGTACVVLRADRPGPWRLGAPRMPGEGTAVSLGGGRYAVVIAHVGGSGALIAAACRIQAAAETALRGRTISLGVAPCHKALSPQQVLANAIDALGRSSGPSGVELAADPAEADALTGIARAVPDPASSALFEMWGEPVVCADTGRLLSVELHPRWNEPVLGTLTVRDVAPAIRSDAQWHDLALRTLDAGIDLLDSLGARGLAPVPLALALPAALAPCERFEQRLAFALDRADLVPGALRIRLDPTLGPAADPGAIPGRDVTRPGCPLIHDAVCVPSAERVAIPAALTRGIDRDETRRRLVSDILRAAEMRGAETLAIGLCRPEEAALMAQFGCTALHGPAIARAMPAPRLSGWIAARAGAATADLRAVPADPCALPARGQAWRRHG